MAAGHSTGRRQPCRLFRLERLWRLNRDGHYCLALAGKGVVMRSAAFALALVCGLVMNTGCAAVLTSNHKTGQTQHAYAAFARNKAASRGTRLQLATTDVLSAEWDYLPAEAPNADRFEIQVDTNARLNLGKPAPVISTAVLLTYRAAIGSYAAGSHTATMFACNSVGCNSSVPVNFTVDVIVPTPTVPAAPSNLRVTGVTSDTVALAWDDVSSNEEGFSIEQNNAEVASVGQNVSSTIVSGLVELTSYTFRARAFNAYGYSPYSSAVSGTTSTPEDTISPTAAITFFRHNGNSRNYTTTAQAVDSVGVTRVIFLIDSYAVATLLTPSLGTAQSGSYTITFTQAVSGIHILTVQVYDARGNMGVASQTFLR
jgi:hypothetical protein